MPSEPSKSHQTKNQNFRAKTLKYIQDDFRELLSMKRDSRRPTAIGVKDVNDPVPHQVEQIWGGGHHKQEPWLSCLSLSPVPLFYKSRDHI